MASKKGLMSRSRVAAGGLVALLIAVPAIMLPGVEAAQQPAAITSVDPFTAVPWGDTSDGLQLRVSTGVATESLTESESLLYLNVQMRNVSEAPVSVDFDSATYDFEFYVPERVPGGILASHTGAGFYVDEEGGTCTRAVLGG
jgi:hypothetical protein